MEAERNELQEHIKTAREEVTLTAEWWRARVEAVREEEEARTEEVEDHVEALSTTLVKGEAKINDLEAKLRAAATEKEALTRKLGDLNTSEKELTSNKDRQGVHIKALESRLETAEDELKEMHIRCTDIQEMHSKEKHARTVAELKLEQDSAEHAKYATKLEKIFSVGSG